MLRWSTVGILLLTTLPMHAQQPRVVFQKWPDPLMVGLVMPNPESLRGMESVSFTVTLVPVEDVAVKMAGSAATLQASAFQARVQEQLRQGGVMIAADSPNSLFVSVGLVCSPTSESICTAQIAARLNRGLKLPAGQDIRAIVWDSTVSLLGPAKSVALWLPTQTSKALQPFVRDWGRCSPISQWLGCPKT